MGNVDNAVVDLRGSDPLRNLSPDGTGICPYRRASNRATRRLPKLYRYSNNIRVRSFVLRSSFLPFASKRAATRLFKLLWLDPHAQGRRQRDSPRRQGLEIGLGAGP